MRISNPLMILPSDEVVALLRTMHAKPSTPTANQLLPAEVRSRAVVPKTVRFLAVITILLVECSGGVAADERAADLENTPVIFVAPDEFEELMPTGPIEAATDGNSAVPIIDMRTPIATAIHPALVALLALLFSLGGLIAFDTDEWCDIPAERTAG